MLKPMTLDDFSDLKNEQICTLICDECYIRDIMGDTNGHYTGSRRNCGEYLHNLLETIKQTKINFKKPMSVSAIDNSDHTIYVRFYREVETEYLSETTGIWIPYEAVSLGISQEISISKIDNDSDFLKIVETVLKSNR